MRMKSTLSAARFALLSGWLLGLGAIPIHSLCSAQEDATAGRLDAAIEGLASDVAKYLKNEANTGSIAVGAFTGQPQLATSSGVAIKKKLTEQLVQQGVDCTREAELACKGEYFFEEDEGAVLMKTYISKGSRRIATLEEQVHNVDDISALLGLTGDIAVNDPEKRKEDLTNAVKQPEVVIEPNQAAPQSGGEPPPKTLIAASAESPYSMEICVLGSDGSYLPVPAVNDSGLAFVDLTQDAVYAVRLINRTVYPAAVRLTIDGLNMFEFSTRPDYRALGVVIIPPRQEGYLIKGWHITNQASDSFVVTEYAKSAKSQLAAFGGLLTSDDDLGTITARFAIALPPGQVPPPDEPALRSLGTKRGPPVNAIFRPMPIRIGMVRTVISVRYSREIPPPG